MIFLAMYGHACQDNTAVGEGVAEDHRRFINAVFWILRTGALWRDLPPDYGGWKNAHRQFCRWLNNGVWEGLLEILLDEPDNEWLMIDASHIKIHPHAAATEGGNQAIAVQKGTQHQTASRYRCGSAVRTIVTQGTTANTACHLIEGMDAHALLADRDYDIDEIIMHCHAHKIDPVIPPKRNRKTQRPYDRNLYQLRHLIENTFLALKRWRGIATRYAKHSTFFDSCTNPLFGSLDKRLVTTASSKVGGSP